MTLATNGVDNAKLNGRRLHVWRMDSTREENVRSFADTCAAAIPDLFVRDGVALAQLGPGGQLNGVNFAALRELIAKHVAGVRLVDCGDEKYEREYFPFTFPPRWRPNPTIGGPQKPPPSVEPNETVYDEVYRKELPARLPRVVG
jgi:hypothetical protein